MDKIIKKLRPLAAFLGLACLWAYLAFTFIGSVGQLAEGGGAASFIEWYIVVAFIGLLTFMYFIKRKEIVNVLLVLLLAYYAMRTIFGAANYFSFGADGVLLAYQIIDLFAFLSLLGAFVLFLLTKVFPGLQQKVVIKIVIYALLAAHVFFSFVGFILYSIGIAQYAWYWVISGIGTMLFVPAAFLFGFMFFNEEGEDFNPFDRKKAPKQVEEKQEEPEVKEEAQPKETPVEETPAE